MRNKIEEQVKKRVKGEARKTVQMEKAEIDSEGREVLDPQPLFAEIGFKQPPSLQDRIRQITLEVQAETAAKLAAQNMTPEEIERVLDEEDDFDVPEDFDDTLTSYELAGVVSDLEEDVQLEVDTSTTPAKQPEQEEATVQKEPETAPSGA
jgi:hypothetical protein